MSTDPPSVHPKHPSLTPTPDRTVEAGPCSGTILSTHTYYTTTLSFLDRVPANNKYKKLARSSCVCVSIADLGLCVNCPTVPHVHHYIYDYSLYRSIISQVKHFEAVQRFLTFLFTNELLLIDKHDEVRTKRNLLILC